LYYTSWKDRYQRTTDNATDNPGGYYDFSGITEIHSGVELEANARVTNKFKVNGMVSIGNWVYDGNSKSNRYDFENNPISGGTATTLYLDKVKVGDAAQLTASIGASYEVFERVILDANYRYSDHLFASIDPGKFTSATYKMLVGKNKDRSLNFRLNVNNVLDKIYIAESRTNIFADDFISGTSGPTYASTPGRTYNGVADANQVFFGFGRTWNFTLRYNF
jgi:outer membrane receptor for monomeric catechols